MSIRACFAILAFLVLSAAPVGARTTCQSLHCASGATVDAARALVERNCPCAAQTSVKGYRRCAKLAIKIARQNLGAALTADCVKDVKVAISESTCGRAGTVVCNKRNKKDTKTTCAVVSASKCTGSACGTSTSCLDACNPSAQACAATPNTTTTTLGGGSTSTTLGGGGTTTTSTTLGGGGTATTSTLGGGGSTSTTSTTMPGGFCATSISKVACVYESCGFGWGDCGWYPLADQEGATGSVSGPVGTVFTPLAERFGFPYGFGGLGYGMDCGGWTPNMGSCVRENSGQPALAAWRVYLLERGCDNGQYSCQVTLPFFYQEVTYIAQCQVPPGPVVETRRKTDSTPEGSAGCVGEGLIGPGYCGNFRSCTE